MILKALYDYYHRSGDLAPLGFDDKGIDFLIIIDSKGNFIRVDDCRTENKSLTFRVIKSSPSRTSGVVPNILWDKADYILNYDFKNEKTSLELNPRTKSIINIVNELTVKYPNNITFKALKYFHDNNQF